MLYTGAHWVVLAETQATIFFFKWVKKKRKKNTKKPKTHITTRQACRKNKNRTAPARSLMGPKKRQLRNHPF